MLWRVVAYLFILIIPPKKVQPASHHAIFSNLSNKAVTAVVTADKKAALGSVHQVRSLTNSTTPTESHFPA